MCVRADAQVACVSGCDVFVCTIDSESQTPGIYFRANERDVMGAGASVVFEIYDMASTYPPGPTTVTLVPNAIPRVRNVPGTCTLTKVDN